MTLHPDDGVELAEMLSFIRDWLATDAAQLAPSLRRFVGADGYDLAELINDLARFAFLLGGNGEELFGTRQHMTEHDALLDGMPSRKASTYKIRKP